MVPEKNTLRQVPSAMTNTDPGSKNRARAESLARLIDFSNGETNVLQSLNFFTMNDQGNLTIVFRYHN